MRYAFFQIAIVILLLLSFPFCKPEEPKAKEKEEIIDPDTIAIENLIAYFPFEGSPVDLVGGLEPSKEASVAYVGGKTGKAYKGLDNSYLVYDIPETSKLRLLEKGFTITSWIRGPKATDSIRIQILRIVKYNFPIKNSLSWQQEKLPKDKQGMFFQWSFGGNDTTYRINKNRDDSVNIKFPSDTWMHIIMTCDIDSKTVNVYKDGARIEALSHKITDMNLNFQYSDKLIIGNRLSLIEKITIKDKIGYFKGNLDELRIYDRGLTEKEVELLYKAEKSQMN